MEFNADIVIVSAFGRGQWLAAELSRKGMKVALLDVSSQLGHWAPEDWEGPFGFFRSEKLRATQIERLLEDDFPEAVTNGVSIFLGQGPLELKGPITKHRLEQLKLHSSAINYVYEYEQALPSRREQLRANIREQSFLQTWLAQLSHYLSSPTHIPSTKAIEYGVPRPFFSSFFIRQATRPGYERSLDWCRYAGVQVHSQVKLVDIAIKDGKVIEGIEIKADKAGLFRGEQFVWMLSSHETAFLSEKIAPQLFSLGSEPEWSWLRYRLHLNGEIGETLPKHMIWLQDLTQPWSHENFCIVQKTFSEHDFDFWLKLPSLQRFNRQYLESQIEKLVHNLKLRLPGIDVARIEYPQEYHYTYAEMGPARFPVMSLEQQQKLKTHRLSNIIHNHSETWGSLDWEAQLMSQTGVEATLKNWWQKQQERKEIRL